MEVQNNIAENPFPRQAVATYGMGALTTENFSYMLNAESELNSYFEAHPLSNRRFGGGLGLNGGHGYGKTHLLMWLAKKAHQLTTADTTLAYAKADTASFFDLYMSFMLSITRERITYLIEKALKNVAIDEVSRVRATESLKDRMKEPAALKTLYKEGIYIKFNHLKAVLFETSRVYNWFLLQPR